MYNIIQHSHSGIMWLAVVMLILSISLNLLACINKNETAKTKRFNLFKFTKWVFYIQAVLGIILLFISEKVHFGEGFMKSSDLRFYGMEHPLMMLIVVGLMAIGLFKAKKKTNATRTALIYYTIALIVVAMMIPWEVVLA